MTTKLLPLRILPALLPIASTPTATYGNRPATLREAALRMTYKHTYRTHAALLRRLETLPSYRHSYASLPAI